MNAAYDLAQHTTIISACEGLAIPRSSFYRSMQPNVVGLPVKRKSGLALKEEERQQVLDTLHSERFVDQTPYEIYARLMDEGHYLCSIRTMYRILNEEKEVKERRKGHRQKHYKKPELLATCPNQVWSWDITKLKTGAKWQYVHLYVIMDIFSRYVVGWMVAQRESASLAEQLIGQTCEKQNIQPKQLTLHADRGPSMKSKTVAQLLSDLMVMKTHNRPHVSNDNPFSESQFKTMKYHPTFPERFGSIQDARVFCQAFFAWYNKEHYHSAIALLTPETVHYQRHERVIEERNKTLLEAFNSNPKRFRNKIPKHPELPAEVWINKPINQNGNKEESNAVIAEI